jgi:hypothetical protein
MLHAAAAEGGAAVEPNNKRTASAYYTSVATEITRFCFLYLWPAPTAATPGPVPPAARPRAHRRHAPRRARATPPALFLAHALCFRQALCPPPQGPAPTATRPGPASPPLTARFYFRPHAAPTTPPRQAPGSGLRCRRRAEGGVPRALQGPAADESLLCKGGINHCSWASIRIRTRRCVAVALQHLLISISFRPKDGARSNWPIGRRFNTHLDPQEWSKGIFFTPTKWTRTWKLPFAAYIGNKTTTTGITTRPPSR